MNLYFLTIQTLHLNLFWLEFLEDKDFFRDGTEWKQSAPTNGLRLQLLSLFVCVCVCVCVCERERESVRWCVPLCCGCGVNAAVVEERV